MFFASDSLYISNEDVFIHLLFTKDEASFIPSWISEPLRISLLTCLKELRSKFSFREAKMHVCMYYCSTSTDCKIGIQFSLALCITSLVIKSCSGYGYMCADMSLCLARAKWTKGRVWCLLSLWPKRLMPYHQINLGQLISSIIYDYVCDLICFLNGYHISK